MQRLLFHIVMISLGIQICHRIVWTHQAKDHSIQHLHWSHASLLYVSYVTVCSASYIQNSMLIETNMLMKMAVFWVVAPCSLVEVHQRFRSLRCLHHQGDDGGSKDLWNVGKLLPDYMALQHRRQPSSYSPPWEPQILNMWTSNKTYENVI
jgi:hypothetical protein